MPTSGPPTGTPPRHQPLPVVSADDAATVSRSILRHQTSGWFPAHDLDRDRQAHSRDWICADNESLGRVNGSTITTCDGHTL